MRALWVHNFPPETVSSGIFMHLLAKQVREMGVSIDLHYTGPLKSISNLIAASKKVTELSRNFDIVHAQYGSACGYVSSFARVPKILTLRGTDLLGSDTGSIKARIHGRIVRCMTARALPFYDRVIVVSDRMQEELNRYFHRSAGVAVLPSGIDLELFQPIDREVAREKLGHANDKRPWVLFSSVTKDNHVKRTHLAIEAVKQAQQDKPELVLQTLTGKPHSEIPLWVNAANVVLLTSTREGWPNIVKEALACNVPFVSTEVSDLNRIARVEPGCFVSCDSSSSIAECLLTAIDQERPSSLSQHVQEMTLEKTGKKLCNIYSSLLENKQGLR